SSNGDGAQSAGRLGAVSDDAVLVPTGRPRGLGAPDAGTRAELIFRPPGPGGRGAGPPPPPPPPPRHPPATARRPETPAPPHPLLRYSLSGRRRTHLPARATIIYFLQQTWPNRFFRSLRWGATVWKAVFS
ncbi:MAG: hypothetical protein KY428_04705, partial [Bacteroidetes bacterium]|nr:hypothetical protein [Bacteroidota bacterium]